MEKPTYDELGERNPELQYGVELDVTDIIEITQKVTENSPKNIDISRLIVCLNKIKQSKDVDEKLEK